MFIHSFIWTKVVYSIFGTMTTRLAIAPNLSYSVRFCSICTRLSIFCLHSAFFRFWPYLGMSLSQWNSENQKSYLVIRGILSVHPGNPTYRSYLHVVIPLMSRILMTSSEQHGSHYYPSLINAVWEYQQTRSNTWITLKFLYVLVTSTYSPTW